MDWSPEQISGQLKNELGIMISHERNYQYIGAGKRHGGHVVYANCRVFMIFHLVENYVYRYGWQTLITKVSEFIFTYVAAIYY